MSDEERIEQLELEVKVLRANNKGLKDKIDKQSKEIEELKEIKFENERTIELFIEGYKRIYKELNIKSLVMNENILINEIKENFTSKDKIKAKIEPRLKEIDEQMKKEWKEYGNSREYQDMEDEWNFLQSLLEKE